MPIAECRGDTKSRSFTRRAEILGDDRGLRADMVTHDRGQRLAITGVEQRDHPLMLGDGPAPLLGGLVDSVARSLNAADRLA